MVMIIKQDLFLTNNGANADNNNHNFQNSNFKKKIQGFQVCLNAPTTVETLQHTQ